MIEPGGERACGGVSLDPCDSRRLIVQAPAVVVQLVKTQDEQRQRKHGKHDEQLGAYAAQQWCGSALPVHHLVSLSVKSVLRRRGGGHEEVRVSTGGRKEAA